MNIDIHFLHPKKKKMESMVLSYALSLNCHQQNGNLAIVPLEGAFCSATFKKRSGGLIDVDLW